MRKRLKTTCSITETYAEKILFLKTAFSTIIYSYHSDASPSSIADVMVQKYVNGIPLYRQAGEWHRKGIDLHRNTLANRVILAARE